MKRFFLTCFILISYLLTVQSQSTDTLTIIDKIFSKWNNSTPGGSVLVARGDKIIYHKAFGLADLEHNVPNTTETIFESGSVAKQFVAASALLLVSEGKISLNDDVRKYVPELPTYQTPITVYHLIHHISGLKDWGVVGELTGWPRGTRVYTQELALHIMTKQKSLNFTPGNEYSYSNSNYTMLVNIVERVSKQTLAEFTQARFFGPLGMTNTQWRDNFREIVSNRSIAYSLRSRNVYQQNMPFENVHGHGGLLTTTGDLLKWNSLLEKHQIGGDQVYNWRVQKGKLNNGQEIAYAGGISVNLFNGFKEISHSGATAGYRTWLAYYPQKKITIILLSNDAASGVVGLGYEIAKLYFGQTPEAKKERKSITLSEEDAKRFTGTFRSIRNFDVFGIEYKDGKIQSNGHALNAAHRDTLFLDNLTWIASKPGVILLKNSQDTSSYRKVNPPDLNPTSLQKLTGAYSSDEAETSWMVEIKNAEVWVNVKPGLSIKLTPSFQDAFLGEAGELFEFKRDKKGNVTGLDVSQSRAERVPFIKKK
ncbi:MAG TPA: serine hydrolase domain-containing protein [Cyclobacteriaceae bacterium]|nr:serine hydrolase domain-containing protein [Cyclobacteriaceae bacterium]